MSLTTVRTYGWLTGTTKQIRNISTYGWFAAGGPPPVFPVQISSIFQLPAEIISRFKDFSIIPIDIYAEVTAVVFEKSIPIERLSGLLIVDQVSPDILSQFDQVRTIRLSHKQEILLPKKYYIDVLTGLSRDLSLAIENRSEAGILTNQYAIPIGYLLQLNNIQKPSFEWGGTTVQVVANRFIPIEYLKNILIVPSFGIEELDYPLMWYLDERGVLWLLDERTTRWLMEYRGIEWFEETRLKDWVLDLRGKYWTLEDVQ